MAKRAYQFGMMAERVVLCFLWLKGYEILAWRYKTYLGEIDIIARKKNTIVIVEVKARRREGSIEEVLHPKQVDRIRRATEVFLARNSKYHNHAIRFDFILINKFFLPKHHQNFW